MGRRSCGHVLRHHGRGATACARAVRTTRGAPRRASLRPVPRVQDNRACPGTSRSMTGQRVHARGYRPAVRPRARPCVRARYDRVERLGELAKTLVVQAGVAPGSTGPSARRSARCSARACRSPRPPAPPSRGSRSTEGIRSRSAAAMASNFCSSVRNPRWCIRGCSGIGEDRFADEHEMQVARHRPAVALEEVEQFRAAFVFVDPPT